MLFSTRCHYGVKNDGIDEECSFHERNMKRNSNSNGQPEGIRKFGEIKINVILIINGYVIYIRYESREWINLAPDSEQWRVLIYIIMSLMFRKGWTIYWLVSDHQIHKISTV